MTNIEQDLIRIPEITKEKINWAEYFDHTTFFTPAEINNSALDLYSKDFEI